jgi:hypothetical protein
VAGAPGTEGQGILATRAAGTLFSGDLGVLVVGRGRRGRERWGVGPPSRGGSLRSPHQESRRRQRNRRLGRAWKCPPPGGLRRGGARHGGTGARRGGIWERCSGDGGRHHSARRAFEEQEAGLLHLEVGNRSSRRPGLERQEFNPFVFCVRRVVPTVPPPSRPPRCLGRARPSPRGGVHRGRRG